MRNLQEIQDELQRIDKNLNDLNLRMACQRQNAVLKDIVELLTANGICSEQDIEPEEVQLENLS